MPYQGVDRKESAVAEFIVPLDVPDLFDVDVQLVQVQNDNQSNQKPREVARSIDHLQKEGEGCFETG